MDVLINCEVPRRITLHDIQQQTHFRMDDIKHMLDKMKVLVLGSDGEYTFRIPESLVHQHHARKNVSSC